MDPRRENLPLTAVRGLAACWVVMHHVQDGMFSGVSIRAISRGYVAVDIFFVLSGFILATLYAGMPVAAAPLFWLRRICRVYPLHLAVMTVLAAGAIAMTLLHGDRSRHDWAAFPVVLTMLQPFVPGVQGWNAPTWSVGVELACYALFPFVTRLLARVPRDGMAALVVMLALAECHVLSRWGGAIDGEGALLRGLVGFHLGVALAAIAPLLRPSVAAGVASLGAGGVAAGIALSDAVTIVLAAAALIAGLAAERGIIARALSAGPLVWLGRVSFSIYLLHGPLIGQVQRLRPEAGPAVQAVLIVMILLPASALTYRFIEQPGRRLPGLLRRRQSAVRSDWRLMRSDLPPGPSPRRGRQA